MRSNDLVLPLDDTIQDRDDYNKAALQYDTYDGKLYAIPYRIECTALMYNMADYTAAGLDPANPPQTWDQWVAASKKMTDRWRLRHGDHRRRRVRQHHHPRAAADLDERRRHHLRRRQEGGA